MILREWMGGTVRERKNKNLASNASFDFNCLLNNLFVTIPGHLGSQRGSGQGPCMVEPMPSITMSSRVSIAARMRRLTKAGQIVPPGMSYQELQLRLTMIVGTKERGVEELTGTTEEIGIHRPCCYLQLGKSNLNVLTD